MRTQQPRRTTGAALAAALAAVSLVGAAAPPPAPAPPRDPSFEGATEVVSVEVPVNVVDREGRPVHGLTADDFVVYDQGQRQKISGFDVVDLTQQSVSATTSDAAGPAPIPSEARRHILLLFDLSFSTPTAVVKARLAARDFVLKSLHPQDLAAIATYSLQQGPRLVVTFTPDRAQLARGIDTLGAHGPDELMGKRDPLRFVIAPMDEMAIAGNNGLNLRSELQAQKDQMVLEYMKTIAQAADRSERQYSEARISGFSRGLAELARMLASVPGRKQVVYFSEGFDSRFMLGNDPSTNEGAEDTQNIVFGEIWKTDSDNRFGNSQLQGELFRMLETFRRADCVLQAIDIGGLRADVDEPGARSRGTGQEVLFYLANETGGELFRNANDFQQQLSHVLERTELTYVLTFERSDLPADGSYRRLKVELAGSHPGARVSHRPGYYTPRPFRDLDPMEKSLLAGDGIASAVPRRDVVVSALVAPFRSTPQLAYVPVVLEVGGETLLDGQSGKFLDAEIYAYASDAHGEMRDFFTQVVRIDLTRARRILEQTGLKYYGHLDLPPGDYRIRVLVRNAQTGRTGVESQPLTVPAYTAAQPFLLPPLFMMAQDGWMMVRERADEAGASIVYPFTVKGEPYVPAARPVVPANTHASLCLVGYNLGTALTVDAKVLAADGMARMGGGSVALVERTPTGIKGFDKLLATFDPTGLAAGDYVLQVAVEDTASGSRQSSSLPITIR
jgi:VWFA-related protein